MAFRWLGTFRQGSWQAYRRFILEERRDAEKRIQVINAELNRIGTVKVFWDTTTDDEGVTTVTEKRLGFGVTPGSSLCKLLQAYTALGGNPFDISMFLVPEVNAALDPTDTSSTTNFQPSGGVAYPKTGSFAPGELWEGGSSSLLKDYASRMGYTIYNDSTIAIRVDYGRKWLTQEIRTKRDNIEARIIKLCDLREQLEQEKTDITLATLGVLNAQSSDTFDLGLSVASIVATIDSIFYEMDETNTPDFETENTEKLAGYPYLLSDVEGGEEDNTAL